MYGPLNPDRPRRLAYCHSLSLIHVWQVENLSPFSVTDARQKLWLNTKDPVQSSGLSVIAISSYRAAVDQGPFARSESGKLKMNTAQHFEYSDDPRFYLQLAQLVSSTGAGTFSEQMLRWCLFTGLSSVNGHWTCVKAVSVASIYSAAPACSTILRAPKQLTILCYQAFCTCRHRCWSSSKPRLTRNAHSKTLTSAISFPAAVIVDGSSAFIG